MYLYSFDKHKNVRMKHSKLTWSFPCVDIKLEQSAYPKELLPYRKACLSYFSRPIRPMLGFKGSQTWMNLFDHQPKTYAILIGSTVLVSVYILKQKDWDWPLR